MAQFNLNWFNTAVIVNANVVGQRAAHRQKSVGGAYSSSGYTPANDLPTTASAVQTPVLANNVVWEFKVDAICTLGGPTINDNGIQEGLGFSCLVPSLSNTDTTATIVLNIGSVDIGSAAFTLHKVSDDSIVSGPITVNKLGTTISHTVTGLDPDTDYYWEFIEYATVGGVVIASSDVNQLGASCFSADISTDPGICAPVTALTSIATEA